VAEYECDKSLDGKHDLRDTGEYRSSTDTGGFQEKRIKCTHCGRTQWIKSDKRNPISRLDVDD